MLTLAGCSATPEVASGGGKSGAGEGADPKKAAAAYVECLKAEGVEGVELFDGQVAITAGRVSEAGGTTDDLTVGDDASMELFQRASETCNTKVPEYSANIPEFKLSSEQLAPLRKFAECARENGLSELGDPDDEAQIEVPVGTTKGQFIAAYKACEDTLMPPEPSAGAGGGDGEMMMGMVMPSFTGAFKQDWLSEVFGMTAPQPEN